MYCTHKRPVQLENISDTSFYFDTLFYMRHARLWPKVLVACVIDLLTLARTAIRPDRSTYGSYKQRAI